MSLFDDKVKKQLTELFSKLKNNVSVVYFTQEIECSLCADNHAFLEEITGLSDKLSLTVYDFQKEKELADRYQVDKIPATVLLDSDKNDTGIKFYGIPAGYEINSFVKALTEVSGDREELPAEIHSRIAQIDKDVHLQVFVTLTCPYCPGAVMVAHRLALENKRIKADMVESSAFQHLALKYDISSVPKTIINEKHEIMGAQPIDAFLDEIEKL